MNAPVSPALLQGSLPVSLARFLPPDSSTVDLPADIAEQIDQGIKSIVEGLRCLALACTADTDFDNPRSSRRRYAGYLQ